MAEKILSCIDCAVKACRSSGGEYPAFCPGQKMDPALLQESLDILRGDDNALVIAAAQSEHDCYATRSRIEETMHMAKLMGAKKLGIATCVGLLSEARQLARIFRAQGFEVYGVGCKCGAQPKNAVGIAEECMQDSPNMCNPVLQALMLNREKTDLNIAVGLCAGHDSLFYKYSEAYVTTVVTKDRLLGHNSVAPLYLLDGYWKRLLQREEFLAPEELPETF